MLRYTILHVLLFSVFLTLVCSESELFYLKNKISGNVIKLKGSSIEAGKEAEVGEKKETDPTQKFIIKDNMILFEANKNYGLGFSSEGTIKCYDVESLGKKKDLPKNLGTDKQLKAQFKFDDGNIVFLKDGNLGFIVEGDQLKIGKVTKDPKNKFIQEYMQSGCSKSSAKPGGQNEFTPPPLSLLVTPPKKLKRPF